MPALNGGAPAVSGSDRAERGDGSTPVSAACAAGGDLSVDGFFSSVNCEIRLDKTKEIECRN